MKWCLLLFISLTVVTVSSKQFSREDIEDNDFADFEEFEEFEDAEGKQVKPEAPPTPAPIVADDDEDDEAVVEEEGNEFDHFQDTEEFEGYSSSSNQPHAASSPQPEIKIAKVPMFQSKQWDNYVMELMILSGLAVYILNFLYGRAKNAKIAQTWFDVHKQILEENFSLVGDDGKKEIIANGVGLVKESEHVYTLWCSGRSCCEGMLVELKMIKRQDLVSMVTQFFRKNGDMVEIKVQMGSDDMDTFVTFAGQKRSATKITKEMNDLVTYGGEKKTGDKHNLPANFVVLSEIGEGTQAVLDARVQAIINKYPEMIEYVHVSDQFSGPKSSDEGGQAVRLPEGKRVIRVGVNFPSFAPGRVKLDEVESMKPVLLLVFYLTEKMKRFRLSKESKQKAEKNRARVEESFLKTTHQARAEAAAQRREERRRMEKEKIMAEEDPDKQRRWEEKESRRQAKKRQPRIKQLKVKAL